MNIAEFLLETLAKNGVERIFGNPGTTEIPLVRACEKRTDIDYIVALSEIAAVPMADGHARTTGRLGVVNLHVAPGLGNGMGALYTASIAGTPLLVLIGGQDRRFLHTQPILWGPVEQMAGTVCKVVHTLGSEYDAAANIARAIRAACSPPFGPVALICPPDLLEQDIVADSSRVQPTRLSGLGERDLTAYSDFLAEARAPAIVAAEDVHWAGAHEALEALAGRIDAPVYVAPYTGALPVASKASCYAGYLPPSLKQISERLAPHDRLLFAGGRGLRTTLYSTATLPQPKAWLGHDPSAQSAAGEFELAVIADLRTALTDIAARVPQRHGTGEARRAAMELPAAGPTLHPTLAIHQLLERFPDALWVDESGLSTSDVRQWMKLPAGKYFINSSGGIGWGVPAAVGAAASRVTSRVVAVVGDGSALYASEALWTAVHHNVNLVLVILANRRYATLNEASGRLVGHDLKSFTLEPPVMDFGGLAQLYGLRHARIEDDASLRKLLAAPDDALSGQILVELKLDPALKPVTAARHF